MTLLLLQKLLERQLSLLLWRKLRLCCETGGIIMIITLLSAILGTIRILACQSVTLLFGEINILVILKLVSLFVIRAMLAIARTAAG